MVINDYTHACTYSTNMRISGEGGKETDTTKPARSRHIATHDHVRDAQHKLTTQTAFANLIRPHNENLV